MVLVWLVGAFLVPVFGLMVNSRISGVGLFLLSLLFSPLIGIIVAACTAGGKETVYKSEPSVVINSDLDFLKKKKEVLDLGVISSDEYDVYKENYKTNNIPKPIERPQSNGMLHTGNKKPTTEIYYYLYHPVTVGILVILIFVGMISLLKYCMEGPTNKPDSYGYQSSDYADGAKGLRKVPDTAVTVTSETVRPYSNTEEIDKRHLKEKCRKYIKSKKYASWVWNENEQLRKERKENIVKQFPITEIFQIGVMDGEPNILYVSVDGPDAHSTNPDNKSRSPLAWAYYDMCKQKGMTNITDVYIIDYNSCKSGEIVVYGHGDQTYTH